MGLAMAVPAPEPLRTVAGVVRGPGDEAIGGARVSVRNAQQTELATAETNSAGRFELPGLPEGSYVVRVTKAGFSEWSGPLRAPVAGEVAVRLALSPVRAEVTVTGEAGVVEEVRSSPQRVNVVDRGVLYERVTTNLSEAAEGAEGVGQQRTAPAMGSFFVRGMTGKGVAVYRDGVRYSTAAQRGGVSTFQNLSDAAHLDAVEFLRGANSAQYGSDALGGVVHLVSSLPSFSPGGVRAQAEAGTFYQSANNAFGSSLAGSVSGGRVAALYSLTGRRVNTIRTGNALDSHAAVTRFLGLPSNVLGERLPDTGFTQYGASLHTQVQLTPLRHLVAHYERAQVDGAKRYDQLLGGDGNLIADLRNLMLDFGYVRLQSYRLGPFQQGWIGASYNAQREERVNQGGQGNPNGTITHQYERTRAFGLQGQLEKRTERHTFLFGGDAYFERIAAPAYTFNPASRVTAAARPRVPDGAEYRQTGFFVQDVWEAAAKLRVSGALRWNGAWYSTAAGALWPADSMSTGALSGRIGAVYKASEWVSLHGLYSRGFRAPNMTDLGSLGLQGNGAYEVSFKEVEDRDAQVGDSASAGARPSGDPVRALKPETSDNLEGGLLFRGTGWRAEVNGFHMKLGQALVSRTLLLPQGAVGTLLGTEPIVRQTANGAVYVALSPNAVLARANSGGAAFFGVEHSARAHLGRSWSLSETLTWIRAEDSATGLPPDIEPGVPAPFMTATLLYAPASRRVWFEVYGQAVDRQARLSTLALEDRRIGATRTRTQIANFFNNGARVRGLVANGILLPTGETVAQVQNRVLGSAAAAPLYPAVPGYAVFGVRGGVPAGRRSDFLIDVSNIGDRNYRGVGWGIDAAGVAVTVKWKVRL